MRPIIEPMSGQNERSGEGAANGYWYAQAEGDARTRAIALLEAFRLYRAADSAMRRRTRDSMSMGENDLLALRYLIRARGEDRQVTPVELARYLAVSTASTTAIVSRLEKSGHVRREQHERDRRSFYIVPTEETDHEVRATLGLMHTRMLEAVVDLSPEENRIARDVLARMRDAVDQVDPPAHD